MGDALYAAGNFEAALNTYHKVVELDPDDAQGHYNLAEMYYDTGKLQDAERECRQALRLDPDFTFAYLTLGNVCLAQEKTREALQAFERFLRSEQSAAAEDVRNEVAAVVAGLKDELA
jgi:tetratricopeptide (TPR) repeat protein